jgi:hypothetical protein
MPTRYCRLMANATDALNCAESLAERLRKNPRDTKLLAMRDHEIERAARYIEKMKTAFDPPPRRSRREVRTSEDSELADACPACGRVRPSTRRRQLGPPEGGGRDAASFDPH